MNLETKTAEFVPSTSMNDYAAEVLGDLTRRVPWEREFLQAVEEVFGSISPALDQEPRYKAEHILERLVEPEKVVSFRVTWTDDQNQIHVNRGHRVQFNSALGPYKGGLRFHSTVNLSTLKFLGFEQTFKNALTGLPLGGGKGGSDFSIHGRSSHELMRFCQAFMTELFRHIGPDTDVPAGDIGVATREIGYLFGQYKRLTSTFNGVLTGKGLAWGGSMLRPEATGYGVVYFTQEMLRRKGESLQGKTVAVSGFGNVAWGTVKKVNDSGGRVVTLSGPDGFIYDPEGVSGEKVDYMYTMRYSGTDEVRQYADRFGVEFFPGKRPWSVPSDIALPCAIQNELDVDDARMLVNNGCRYVVEGANMPVTLEAVKILQQGGVLYAPGKASNAGGVAVSGLEMSQNRMGIRWEPEKVDDTLRTIMRNIHELCVDSAQRFGSPDNYLMGANIGGFVKVADAMIDHGAI